MGALITQTVGLKQPIFDKLEKPIDFATGFAAGVALNDIWEIGKLPGYFQTVFSFQAGTNTIGVGWDDIAQVGVGALTLLVGGRFLGTHAATIGLGMIAGTIATKVSETFNLGFKIQLIPHTAVAPTGAAGIMAGASAVTDGVDQQQYSQAYPSSIDDGTRQFSQAYPAITQKYSQAYTDLPASDMSPHYPIVTQFAIGA